MSIVRDASYNRVGELDIDILKEEYASPLSLIQQVFPKKISLKRIKLFTNIWKPSSVMRKYLMLLECICIKR